jgi:prepilin-type N-terminal cleavage/methylation domain-containing protein
MARERATETEGEMTVAHAQEIPDADTPTAGGEQHVAEPFGAILRNFESARREPDRPTTRGFTLIELIAVMLIMSIAVGIAAVAWHSGHGGAAVNSAAMQVHATLRLARQYAITRRAEMAFVVVPHGYFGDYPDVAGLHDGESRYYAVINLKDRAYVQAWKALPGNVVFDWVQTPDPARTYNVFGLSAPKTVVGVPFPGTQNSAPGQLRDFRGLVFRPNGQIRQPQGLPYIHTLVLSEGAMTPEGSRLVPWLKPGGITYRIEVSFAGGVRIEG